MLPHFNYCSTIWNDGSCAVIKKLSKLHKRAARAITGDTYDIRSKQVLEEVGWLPIDESLKKREATMTFKALTGRLPDYLTKLFSKCENSNYSLRSNHSKLALPKPKTSFLKRSFSYRAAKSWNELSCETIDNYENISISSFKKRLLAQ